jgi:uracil phosphoribosyltransferase
MRPINILGQENSIFNQFLAEIRSEDAQGDSMRFRRNLERLGEIFAYEISKTMEYENREVVTPLGIANMKLLKDKPILATILRAGLPMHQGMLNYFDDSENAFISAFRKHYRDGSFEIQVDYMSAPDIEDRTLIIVDPMLATGKSMILAYEELLNNGKPKHTHIVCAIASAQGIEYLQKNLSPRNCTIWVGAVDDELTANSFIVPGLGDAGDLAYGNKLND